MKKQPNNILLYGATFTLLSLALLFQGCGGGNSSNSTKTDTSTSSGSSTSTPSGSGSTTPTTDAGGSSTGSNNTATGSVTNSGGGSSSSSSSGSSQSSGATTGSTPSTPVDNSRDLAKLQKQEKDLKDAISQLKNQIEGLNKEVENLLKGSSQVASLQAQKSTLEKDNQQLQVTRYDFATTSSFTRVWWDRGSGADKDVAFYHPNPTKGYKYVGDYCQGNYSNPRGTVLVAKPRDGKAIPPNDYELVWNDKGSGADEDFSCWRPIPPSGYVALGLITVKGYQKPSTNLTLCVHKDFVEDGTISGSIWNDKGSAADKDFSVWGIQETGLFAAHATHAKYTGKVYKIKAAYTQSGIKAKIDSNNARIKDLDTKITAAAKDNAEASSKRKEIEALQNQVSTKEKELEVVQNELYNK